MNVFGCDVLLISSYSLGKADVNYHAGALCALELNCCAGSKLPGGSPGDAYSSDAHSQTLRVSLTHYLQHTQKEMRLFPISSPKSAGTGNRTRDLRTTNATLYRLSHASIFCSVRSEPHQMRFSVRRKKNITIAPGHWQVRNRN